MVEQQSFGRLNNTFPSISERPIDIPERERSYSKDNIIQQDIVEGENKAIIMVDSEGTERLLIGFDENEQ